MSRIIAAVALAFSVATGVAESPAKPQTYREILAARPTPDLTTLVKRSSPKTQGDDASESFMDLLKVRETADPKALVVLEGVLVENLPTTRIHRFAAAEALFSIGTPEAHQVLARHVLAKEMRVGLAVDYTSHWEMQEPLRSRFIDQYLLKSLAKDLVVEVQEIPSTPKMSGHFDLAITIRNTSDETFHVSDHGDFPGDMLHLRDANGLFVPRIKNRTMCKAQSTNIELKPGKSHRVNATIDVAAADPKQASPRSIGKLAADVRESGHYFDINSPGKFEILALFEAEPLTDEQRAYLKVEQDWKWWSGRAVSKPLPITIAQPVPLAPEK